MNLRRVLPLLILLATGRAAEPTVTVPPEVAQALTAARDQKNPTEALAKLEPFKDSGQALVNLVRGQLLAQLAREGPVDQQADRRREAEVAFTAAARNTETQRPAHLGLAQLAADRGDWAAASRELGVGLDWINATSSELQFAAQVAVQAGDWRAAHVIVNQGILRYPAEPSFRRLELASLVRGGRAEEARQALRALLTTEPTNAEWWRQLAWAAHEVRDESQALAALELALLVKPEDFQARRTLATAQMAQHLPQAALATVRPLLGNPPRDDAVRDGSLMEFAVRVAAEAGETSLARSWLAALPPNQRTRGIRLLEAQLALKSQDSKAAVAALSALIELGEKDARVLTWAGQVAEQAGDTAGAEGFWTIAANTDQPDAATARLRLVNLYLRQKRIEEARTLLAIHRSRNPADAEARALQDLLDRSPK